MLLLAFRPSICPHVTPWELLNEFSWNLLLRGFIKICHGFPVLVKIRQL
jgi:hypothetical protein